MKNIVIIRNAAADDFGGGERFPVLLATVLKNKGYAPTILSRSEKLRRFAHHNGITAHKSWWWSHQNWSGRNTLLIPVYIIWQFVLYMYYLGWFIKLQPHVAHIQSKDDFIAASLAAKTIGAKIVWTDHADLKHILNKVDEPLRNPSGKLVRIAARFASVITVVSKSEMAFVTQHLKHRPDLSKKIRVIYNGAFDVSSQHPHQTQDTFAFVYVGRLVRDKGIRELIEAFNKLSDDYSDSQLLIIGDGPDRKDFEKTTSDSAITFLGHQNNPLEQLALADVFVYPTYHEGFSLSLVEAAMMSLPIITTNVGGNPEIIIDNTTGLLVPAQDTASLYDAMVRLRGDAKLRQRLGNSARISFEKSFQFDKIVKDSFIPIYEST